MTVEQLIERLSEMPGYWKVHLSDGGGSWPVTEVEQGTREVVIR